MKPRLARWARMAVASTVMTVGLALCGQLRAGDVMLPPVPVELAIVGPDTSLVPAVPFPVSVSVRVTGPIQHRTNFGDMIHFRLGTGLRWISGDTLIIVRLSNGFAQTFGLELAARDTGDFSMDAFVRTDRSGSSGVSLREKAVFGGWAGAYKRFNIQIPSGARTDPADSLTIEQQSAGELGVDSTLPKQEVEGDTLHSSSMLPASPAVTSLARTTEEVGVTADLPIFSAQGEAG